MPEWLLAAVHDARLTAQPGRKQVPFNRSDVFNARSSDRHWLDQLPHFSPTPASAVLAEAEASRKTILDVLERRRDRQIRKVLQALDVDPESDVALEQGFLRLAGAVLGLGLVRPCDHPGTFSVRVAEEMFFVLVRDFSKEMSGRKAVAEVAQMLIGTDLEDALAENGAQPSRSRPLHRPQLRSKIATKKVQQARRVEALRKRWNKLKKRQRQASSSSAKASLQKWQAEFGVMLKSHEVMSMARRNLGKARES